MRVKREVLEATCQALGVSYTGFMEAYETIAFYGMDQYGKGFTAGSKVVNYYRYDQGYSEGYSDRRYEDEREEAKDTAIQYEAPSLDSIFVDRVPGVVSIAEITGDDEHAYVTTAVDAFDAPEPKASWRENDDDYGDGGYYAECNCDTCQERRVELGGPEVVLGF